MSEGFAAEASDLSAGVAAVSRLADYHLEERIGAGGMAVVFRARDEQCGWAKTLAIASQAPTFCPCLLPIANLPPLPPDSRPVRTVESFSYVCLRFALAARSACQSSDRLS